MCVGFPAGILQGQFFSSERPMFQNFASIGTVIGHEITHGFDDQGRQFDADGNLVDWWDEKTSKSFDEKAQCIVEQFGNFTEPLTGLSLNGVNTQGENIADNGGIKLAYRAYQAFVKSNRLEEFYSNSNSFTTNQLFWITSAQTWCGVFTEEAMKRRILTGVHSPNPFRVLGTFTNLKEFSDDFQCSPLTPMNPAKKCQVW
jgi:neprilysin